MRHSPQVKMKPYNNRQVESEVAQGVDVVEGQAEVPVRVPGWAGRQAVKLRYP